MFAKKLGSAGASIETLNAASQHIDPMNRTYSKESLQTQFVNYSGGGVRRVPSSSSASEILAAASVAIAVTPPPPPLPTGQVSRISASRRQSRTISSSNHENLPIIEGACERPEIIIYL